MAQEIHAPVHSSSHTKIKGSKRNKHKDFSDDKTEITVDVDSDKPTKAWERLQEFHISIEITTDTCWSKAKDENSLRFVCLSDTHRQIESERRKFLEKIPNGDVLIHCGDFSLHGSPDEIIAFDSFMAQLPHPVKLVIAGNHDMTLQQGGYKPNPIQTCKHLGLPLKASDTEITEACKDLLQHFVYLEDESLEICGIKMYFSPWVPVFGCSGFGLRRGQNLLDIWNCIPSDTDILVTHCPPCGYGDLTQGNNNAGCVELLNTVAHRVKPKFHVFGHIHNGYGMWTNNKTVFINCAICDDRYKPERAPVVFDFPFPNGFSRKDFETLTTESIKALKSKNLEKNNVLNLTDEVSGIKLGTNSTCTTLNQNKDSTANLAVHDSVKEMIDTGHLRPEVGFSYGFASVNDRSEDGCAVNDKLYQPEASVSNENKSSARSCLLNQIHLVGTGRPATASLPDELTFKNELSNCEYASESRQKNTDCVEIEELEFNNRIHSLGRIETTANQTLNEKSRICVKGKTLVSPGLTQYKGAVSIEKEQAQGAVKRSDVELLNDANIETVQLSVLDRVKMLERSVSKKFDNW